MAKASSQNGAAVQAQVGRWAVWNLFCSGSLCGLCRMPLRSRFDVAAVIAPPPSLYAHCPHVAVRMQRHGLKRGACSGHVGGRTAEEASESLEEKSDALAIERAARWAPRLRNVVRHHLARLIGHAHAVNGHARVVGSPRGRPVAAPRVNYLQTHFGERSEQAAGSAASPVGHRPATWRVRSQGSSSSVQALQKRWPGRPPKWARALKKPGSGRPASPKCENSIHVNHLWG